MVDWLGALLDLSLEKELEQEKELLMSVSW